MNTIAPIKSNKLKTSRKLDLDDEKTILKNVKQPKVYKKIV